MLRTKSREQTAAVVFRDHFQLHDVVDLVRGHHHRPEAEKRIDALGPRQIPRILAQNIERRQIQRSRVPEDRLGQLSAASEIGSSADDHAELALGIDIVRHFRRRQHDFAAGRNMHDAGFMKLPGSSG